MVYVAATWEYYYIAMPVPYVSLHHFRKSCYVWDARFRIYSYIYICLDKDSTLYVHENKQDWVSYRMECAYSSHVFILYCNPGSLNIKANEYIYTLYPVPLKASWGGCTQIIPGYPGQYLCFQTLQLDN